VHEGSPADFLGLNEIPDVPCGLEAPYEGIGERHPPDRAPRSGRLRESGHPAQQLDRGIGVGGPFYGRTVGKSRAVSEREAVEGVPVRVVIAVRDGPDQTDGLVEGSDVTRLLGIDDQICRMFQRVAPRVVPGLSGEPRPQLTWHSPVIDQVEQAEHTDGYVEVFGGKGAVPVRHGAGPIERGNGVKDIGVGLFGASVDRGEEIHRES
jgi:hypothetical protein